MISVPLLCLSVSMDFTRDDFAFLIKAIEENEQNNKCQLAEIILKIGKTYKIQVYAIIMHSKAWPP